jgi:hypothetical protein
LKPTKEGNGISLSLKVIVKPIEEGKEIVISINIGFLQSEMNGRYSHIDGTRVGWQLMQKYTPPF